MRTPPGARPGVRGGGEGEEDVVERGLAAVYVDHIDAGVVEGAHHVDDAGAGEDGRGDDELVLVDGRVVGRERR